MELQGAIKEILWKNNFVSLPGLGSFSKSYEPAKLSSDGHTFIPPRQTITFDRSRSYNDEAIENYLKEKHGFTQAEAVTATQDFLKEIVKKLDSGESVSFEGLGALKKEKHRGVDFVPLENSQLASETFGLTSVELDLDASKEIKPTYTKAIAGETKDKRAKIKKLVIGIAAAIVIIGLFSSILYFLIPSIQLWQTEDVKSSQLSSADESTPAASEGVDISPDGIDNQAGSDSLEAKILDDHVVKSVETKTDKKKALFYQEPKTQDTKTYYIISGSYLSIENAQKHYDQLAGKGYKPDIIQGNGNYRVSMVKFTDRNRALNELERIRTQNPKESVWLLGI